MKYIRILSIYIFVSLLIACTNQEVYKAVKENRLQECQKLPPSAYEECTKQYGQSYEEYETERQELLKETKNDSQ